MRALRWLSLLMLMAGTAITGRALYLHAKARLAGVLIRRSWEETLQTGKVRAPWPWADMYPIARLQIPRLGYDEIVLDGATPRTLAFGPARLMSSVGLGEAGNLVLAGHRTSWFLPLEKIAQGDQIQVEWFDTRQSEPRVRNYAVSMIGVVDRQDVTLLKPTQSDALTMITCYPFGHSPRSPQRFVIRATPVGTSSRVHNATKGEVGSLRAGSSRSLLLD